MQKGRSNEPSPSIERIGELVGNVVDSSQSPAIVVVGGYFDLSTGGDDFACNSFDTALTLGRLLSGRHGHKVQVCYAVLVNDLGIDCSVNCEISSLDLGTSNTLSAKFELVLGNHPDVNRDQIIMMGERRARNRGLRRLKKLLKRSKGGILGEREGEDGIHTFFRSEGGSEVMLAHHQGERWAAHCPLIMGSYYADLFETAVQQYSAQNPIVVVDFAAITDRGKVTLGGEFALRGLLPAFPGGGRRLIYDVFFRDDAGSRTLIEQLELD